MDIDPDDLDWYFREMRPYITQCKFKLDCRHEDEPGCAVRQRCEWSDQPASLPNYLRLKENFCYEEISYIQLLNAFLESPGRGFFMDIENYPY